MFFSRLVLCLLCVLPSHLSTTPLLLLFPQAFGATDFVNSLDLPPGCASIQAHIVSMTKWGADFTFDCTGNVEVMRAALECAHRGTGSRLCSSI